LSSTINHLFGVVGVFTAGFPAAGKPTWLQVARHYWLLFLDVVLVLENFPGGSRAPRLGFLTDFPGKRKAFGGFYFGKVQLWNRKNYAGPLYMVISVISVQRIMYILSSNLLAASIHATSSLIVRLLIQCDRVYELKKFK
jgi:hypothetical protein